jgi:outer membrane biogenesis lipoprotein LolB
MAKVMLAVVCLLLSGCSRTIQYDPATGKRIISHERLLIHEQIDLDVTGKYKLQATSKPDDEMVKQIIKAYEMGRLAQ